MEGLFRFIGMAAGALLGLAVLIAAWEHLRRGMRPASFMPPAPPPVAQVDVDVEALTPVSEAVAARQRTLQETMQRPSDAGAVPPATESWTETRPMVASGKTAITGQD
jgi:hypothetical protein